MSNTTYVYTHTANEKIIYVGCGSATRAFCLNGRTSAWEEATAGHEVAVDIIDEFDDKGAALVLEAEMIRDIRPIANLRVISPEVVKQHNKTKKRNRESVATQQIILGIKIACIHDDTTVMKASAQSSVPKSAIYRYMSGSNDIYVTKLDKFCRLGLDRTLMQVLELGS